MKFTNALLIAACAALALPSEAEVSSAALTDALSAAESPTDIADVHRELGDKKDKKNKKKGNGDSSDEDGDDSEEDGGKKAKKNKKKGNGDSSDEDGDDSDEDGGKKAKKAKKGKKGKKGKIEDDPDDTEEEKAAKRAARKIAGAAQEAEAKCHMKGASKAEQRAARKAERDVRKAAKKALKKLRKAEKKLKKKTKANRKKDKKPETNTEIVGGHCVADHVCASVRGDPHMTTFDGLKFDCQGHGEFVLAKSMSTAFEVQGRFELTGREDKSVSITKAISIDTGVEGAPTFDVFAEELEGVCILNYYANGVLTDFGPDGKGVEGIDFMEDIDTGKELVDYVYFTGSGVMYTVMVKKGSWGCVLNSKICLPPNMVEEEEIIGLLGSPNDDSADDWMTAYGEDLDHSGDTGLESSYDYCTTEWCVHNADDSIFAYEGTMGWADYYGCGSSYDSSAEDAIAAASDECKACCSVLSGLEYAACLLECVEGDVGDCEIEIVVEEGLDDVESQCPDTSGPSPSPGPRSGPEPAPKPAPEPAPEPRSGPSPAPKKGSSSGDPHFKTWTGEKYDYHGECDLVLLDDPSFNNGQGLRVHVRTTRVKYFSYIEKAAIQIGDEVLEFDNDIENFLINGEKVEANEQHHKTMLGGFVVRRDKKAISIRLQDDKTPEARRAGQVAKIDLHTRKNGFPAVIIDGGKTEIFRGSLGLLGDWATGRKLARDGETEIEVDEVNAEAFALEWQVRDTDPMLFKDARFPQWPTTCTPPAKVVKTRIGMEKARKEAEEACAHWAHDKDDCIFDVMATRDVLVAEEGHIVHLE